MRKSFFELDKVFAKGTMANKESCSGGSEQDKDTNKSLGPYHRYIYPYPSSPSDAAAVSEKLTGRCVLMCECDTGRENSAHDLAVASLPTCTPFHCPGYSYVLELYLYRFSREDNCDVI